MYPYDYVDSLEKLNETCLTSKEELYSKLNRTNISDDDYKHAKEVWKTFNIKTMRKYHDLYLKSDVIILAGVFETFKDVCIQHSSNILTLIIYMAGQCLRSCQQTVSNG